MSYNFSRGIPDWLGLPLAKESPFMEPLNVVLYKLKQNGAIEKIWKKYQPHIDKQCEEPKVSKCHKCQGFARTFSITVSYYNFFFFQF